MSFSELRWIHCISGHYFAMKRYVTSVLQACGISFTGGIRMWFQTILLIDCFSILACIDHSVKWSSISIVVNGRIVKEGNGFKVGTDPAITVELGGQINAIHQLGCRVVKLSTLHAFMPLHCCAFFRHVQWVELDPEELFDGDVFR